MKKSNEKLIWTLGMTAIALLTGVSALANSAPQQEPERVEIALTVLTQADCNALDFAIRAAGLVDAFRPGWEGANFKTCESGSFIVGNPETSYIYRAEALRDALKEGKLTGAGALTAEDCGRAMTALKSYSNKAISIEDKFYQLEGSCDAKDGVTQFTVAVHPVSG